MAGLDGQNGLFASAVQDGNLIYVKVANTSEAVQELTFNFTGLKKNDSVRSVKRILLRSENLYVDNSLESPDAIVPLELPSAGEGQSISATVEPLSFSVFILER